MKLTIMFKVSSIFMNALSGLAEMTKTMKDSLFGADMEILYIIWGGHNPNNQDDNENYIELRLDHRKWNDRSCDHVAMFVCEKNIY